MDCRTKHRLYRDVHEAIEMSLKNTRYQQEPDYIAAVVTFLPIHLSSILQHHIPSAKFRVKGCFIHQKPLARFCKPMISNRKAPEIGDLLVVYKEINSGTAYYNALILQAKKTNNIYKTLVSTSDEHQLRLYTEWPKFKYERAGLLNGQVRSITPKTITPGAQYLLIDERSGCPYTFWCAKPNKVLVASKPLAHLLIDLIEFQTGKPFTFKSGNIDHWSKMIWDLLSISANAVFNRSKAGFKNSSRISGNITNLLADLPNDIQLDDDSVGIPLLYIERDNRVKNTLREE